MLVQAAQEEPQAAPVVVVAVHVALCTTFPAKVVFITELKAPSVKSAQLLATCRQCGAVDPSHTKYGAVDLVKVLSGSFVLFEDIHALNVPVRLFARASF